MSDDTLLPGTQRALLHRLAAAQVEGRAPAMVAGIVRDGELRWSAGRGEVAGTEPDRKVGFMIGSITKTFTAVLVMRMRDDGLLDLGDPLGRHLPDVRAADVTVAQLLSHTAGIASEPPGPWWERTPGALRPDLAAQFDDHYAKHPPGRRFHYSNPGYGLLGALVERLRGVPWLEAAKSELLEPLGMADTGLTPPAGHASGWAVHPWADLVLPEPLHDYGVMAPAGAFWSTAADLGRWASFLIDGDERILATDSLDEMRQPASPPEPTEPGGGYGLGLEIVREDGRDFVGHGGSLPGFLAGLWVSPADGVGAVVLCNTTAGVAISSVGRELVTIVAEQEPRIPSAWKASSDPDLVELAGPWYWGPAPLALRVRTGRDLDLTMLRSQRRATRLRPQPDGTWLGLDGYFAGERLRVVRDADGRVVHLDLGTFVLTRTPYDPDGDVPGGVDAAGWRR